MAQVQQLIDHMNYTLRKTYKEGLWVTSYVTKIGKNKSGHVFFECIDKSKHDSGKPASMTVFRLMEVSISGYHELLAMINEGCDFSGVREFKRGDLCVAFKVMPSVHFERGFMPVVRDLSLDDSDVQIRNVRGGLRVGVENTQKNKPQNCGEVWSKDDNDKLSAYVTAKNLSFESIGLLLKRTPLACIDKAFSLGVLSHDRYTNERKRALKGGDK